MRGGEVTEVEPRSRPHVPVESRAQVARGLQMLREQRRVLIFLFDRVCHPPVQLGAIGLELRFVSHRAHQRVVEGVLGIGREADLIDQLGADQIPNDFSVSALNREPTTAAALRVFLASAPRRSIRAAMAACSVPGTLTSETSVRQVYSPRSPSSTRRSASSRTISCEKNGLPATRLAMTDLIAATDGSEPNSSSSNTVVSESARGASEIVCAPETWANAPRYSGR